MQKLIILSIISFLFFSCDLLEADPLGPDTGMRFASADAAIRWVNSNIIFSSDFSQYGKNEFWAYPAETLKSRRGDCEDFSLLALKLIKDSGFGEHYFIGITIKTENHAIIEVNGKLIDAQAPNDKILGSINFRETYRRIGLYIKNER